MLGTRLLITLGFIAFMPAAEVQAAEVSPAAQSSCMAAVNNQYGGSVRDLKIVSSEFSQANSVVMVKAIGIRGSNQSENWKCLVSNQAPWQICPLSAEVQRWLQPNSRPAPLHNRLAWRPSIATTAGMSAS